MVRLVAREALDLLAYDRCMAGSPDRIIYAFSWYLDAVSPDWACLVKGDYESVMPLPLRRRYGWKAVMQPLFCHQLGVFADGKSPDAAELQPFLICLTQHFRYVPAYPFHAGNAAELAADLTPRTNHILNLNRPYEALRNGYSRGRRHHLNKAGLLSGWEMTTTDHIGPLFDLFVKHNTVSIGRIDPQAGQILRRLTDACLERGMAQIRMAHYGGEPEAGSLFLHDERRIIHLFCAASPLGRRANARMVLLDQVIRENAGRAVWLDFESPEVESLARFNREFGAVAEPFGRLSYNRLPAGIRALHACKKSIHRFLVRS
ncbi:GNAT family N-acetyltransferase [Tellurirhabdus rosea]|uniref:GNAT family N-acetyltransferase n=1 Tax=Tellurirhabdus rosea TaxID=2674997 RepID=UPI002250EDCF|nr:GNAT family N-acetyltransferase [Tellurirhabdus rosea]